jgi:hypothetical protein
MPAAVGALIRNAARLDAALCRRHAFERTPSSLPMLTRAAFFDAAAPRLIFECPPRCRRMRYHAAATTRDTPRRLRV